MIVQRYPKSKFYLPVVDKCKDAYIDEKNVKIFSLNRFIRGVNKLLKNIRPLPDIYSIIEGFGDVVVLIGGSLFQEKSNDGSDINRLNEMPGKKKPLYILGINFGPYKTEKYLKRTKEYISTAKDVCFRDMRSYTLFNDLNNTRVATDIIFGIEKLIPSNKNKCKLCVISVLDFSGNDVLLKYKQEYIDFMLKAIEKYSFMGYKVILMSFCKMEGDEDAIEEILHRCNDKFKKNLRTHFYDGINWRETVEIISSSSCIIATRFHSMILGFVYGIQTLPIIYNEKSLNILRDLDCEEYCIRLEDLGTYDFSDIRYAKPKNMNKVKMKAVEQFKVLDTILN